MSTNCKADFPLLAQRDIAYLDSIILDRLSEMAQWQQEVSMGLRSKTEYRMHFFGEDAENKTVPVILCAEENVEGSHGATIGELDADTLFYFASRGIDRAAAEAILARAAVERLARMAEDEAFSARALGALAQVLCMKEERE